MPAHRISATMYGLVAQDANSQCGYCRAPQRVLPYRLEIEHLLPISLGGSDERDNLWLSCHKCNKLRSNRLQALDPHTQLLVPIYSPRQQYWEANFAWANGGLQIVGKTASGRATVGALELNDSFHQSARSVWILAGLFPPV